MLTRTSVLLSALKTLTAKIFNLLTIQGIEQVRDNAPSIQIYPGFSARIFSSIFHIKERASTPRHVGSVEITYTYTLNFVGTLFSLFTFSNIYASLCKCVCSKLFPNRDLHFESY